ncbi:hypothetical protein [Candidatus Binatus sp.]|uniref:hypothetical protein n=1 Tax=Candidatus Binatus sp. TaxID=2811406 RepID=UPI003CC599F6
MADLEVLEVVATLDFAHRHMSQAALLPVIVDWRKVLKPNPFFMELTAARQPSDGSDITWPNRKKGTRWLHHKGMWPSVPGPKRSRNIFIVIGIEQRHARRVTRGT